MAQRLRVGKELQKTLVTGASPHLHELVPYKELHVHLKQIKSSENVPMPTLLRTLPVKDEEFNSGRAEEFTRLQYKKLECGYITEFKVALSDNSQQIVDVGYTSVVIHLTRDG